MLFNEFLYENSWRNDYSLMNEIEIVMTLITSSLKWRTNPSFLAFNVIALTSVHLSIFEPTDLFAARAIIFRRFSRWVWIAWTLRKQVQQCSDDLMQQKVYRNIVFPRTFSCCNIISRSFYTCWPTVCQRAALHELWWVTDFGNLTK